MKSKLASIISIASVIMVAVVVSLIIIFTGIKNGGYNYVKLQSGFEIEFITNSKDKVISFKPLNEKARLIIANENFDGISVEEAINNVLIESLKMGYLATNDDDFNVIKLTVVSGLTQAVDVNVYRTVNNFLVNNEVLALIIENQNDMEYVKEAKQLGIGTNKLALINSVIDSSTKLTKEQLKNKMEDELIDIIKTLQENYMQTNPITEEEIQQKEDLIEQNQDNYNLHISNINNKEKGAFVLKLQELQSTEQRKYELNFSKHYNLNV